MSGRCFPYGVDTGDQTKTSANGSRSNSFVASQRQLRHFTLTIGAKVLVELPASDSSKGHRGLSKLQINHDCGCAALEWQRLLEYESRPNLKRTSETPSNPGFILSASKVARWSDIVHPIKRKTRRVSSKGMMSFSVRPLRYLPPQHLLPSQISRPGFSPWYDVQSPLRRR